MRTIQSILYATDFSDQSQAAFPLAVALARVYGATLTVAHVLPAPVLAYTTGEVATGPNPTLEEVRETLRKTDPKDPSVHMEYEVVEGEPSTEILALANKIHCDLIIVGTHGRSGLSRLLVGSVAEEVMRHAPCPVFTLRLPAESASLQDQASEPTS
jgi:universal stress protein A